jgi:hypothetical protein
MSAPKLMGPGMWVDEANEMHVSIPELLEVFGWPDDDQHRATCERLVRQVVAEHFPGIPIRRED